MNAIAGITESFAIGSYVQTTASGAISIGTSDAGSEMINNINSSLMIGFSSKVPTFFISNSDYTPDHTGTGKIGIATTEPKAKLHVNGDTYIQNDLAVGNKLSPANIYVSSLRSDRRQFIVADKLGKLSLVTDAEIPGDNLGNHTATMDISLFNWGLKYDNKYLKAAIQLNSGNEIILNGNIHSGSNEYKFNAYHFGKVGINTADPQNEIEVSGNVAIGYNTHLPEGSNMLIVSGKVGIGTFAPTEKLEVAGKIKTNQFQITNGFMNGYILTSDPYGNAIWSNPRSIDIGVWERNGNIVYVNQDKRIGIGTSTPRECLELTGNAIIGGDIFGRKASYIPLKIYAGASELDGSFISLENNIGAGGSIKFYSVGPGSRIEFHSNGNQLMSIRADNNIVIGNPNPEGQINMKVNGEIHSNLIKVEVTGWWDEVFNYDYNLQSLGEVENYIKEHKHLPDFPSESEVLNNGIDVAQMNSLLLKKIEELTLYVIELEKKVNTLSK